MVSFSVLLTSTLCETLKVQACTVALHEVLWYVVRWFGRILSCSIYVPTDYLSGAIFNIDVTDDMIGGVHIRTISMFPWRSGVFHRSLRFTSCGVERRIGRGVLALSVMYQVIDWGSVFSRGAGVPRVIDITFDIPSLLIVMVCKVTAVIRSGSKAFGRSLDGGSSAIRPAPVFRIGHL